MSLETEQLTTLHTIPRDRWKRPLVSPIGGGKPIAYTRCTTYVGVLEDRYNLERWQQRMVVTGLAHRADLLLSAAAHLDDKDRLDKIAESAIEAAQASAAATIGTALHSFTEQYDRGAELGPVPAAFRPDIDAYIAATEGMRHTDVERFVVLDDLKIGGTPDRITEYDGQRWVFDLKTGSLDWGMGTIAQQLAVYAHSAFYNPATFERTPVDVNLDRAIVVHLPQGEGVCTLHWVDISAGWHAVTLASRVREWRKRKDLLTPFKRVDTGPVKLSPLTSVADYTAAPTVAGLIGQAASVDALTELWRVHQGEWTAELTTAAAARKAQLLGAA